MNIKIGENIKALRRAKGITQETLSEAMNVTCAAVSKWERGETYPDITALIPLANYFGVTLDELMGCNQERVQQEIQTALEHHHETLAEGDYEKAHTIIVEAYAAYPTDYRVMDAYLWDICGGKADTDAEVLLDNKETLLKVSGKILDGCTDIRILTDAYQIQSKLLCAEGKTEDALVLLSAHLPDWYGAVGQRSEQLFAKGTPEYLAWVKQNMQELSRLAADKLARSVFFDTELTLATRIEKIEGYADAMRDIWNGTKESFFETAAKTIYLRLANDLTHYAHNEDEAVRIKEKANA